LKIDAMSTEGVGSMLSFGPNKQISFASDEGDWVTPSLQLPTDFYTSNSPPFTFKVYEVSSSSSQSPSSFSSFSDDSWF
jgi:hypothetical protein